MDCTILYGLNVNSKSQLCFYLKSWESIRSNKTQATRQERGRRQLLQITCLNIQEVEKEAERGDQERSILL